MTPERSQLRTLEPLCCSDNAFAFTCSSMCLASLTDPARVKLPLAAPTSSSSHRLSRLPECDDDEDMLVLLLLIFDWQEVISRWQLLCFGCSYSSVLDETKVCRNGSYTTSPAVVTVFARYPTTRLKMWRHEKCVETEACPGILCSEVYAIFAMVELILLPPVIH